MDCNLLALITGEDDTTNYSMVYDNNAYISTRYGANIPRIRKLDLSAFSWGNYLDLGSANANMYGFAHDTVNGYLYAVVTSVSYKRLYKIKLLDFSIDSYLDISAYWGVNWPFGWQCGAVDTTNNIGYWSYEYRMIKINLSPLSVAGTINIDSYPYWYWHSNQAVIDLNNGYVYSSGEELNIGRIRLSDFSYIDKITLNEDDYESEGTYAVMFIYNNYLYLPVYGSNHARLIKVDLSTFTRITHVDIPNTDFISYANHDGRGCGYITCWDTVLNSYVLIKINLDTMEIKSTDTVAKYPEFGCFIDGQNNYFYCADPWISSPYGYISKCQIQCSIATPCNSTNESSPIGGDCESISDPTTNFSKIRSAIEL